MIRKIIIAAVAAGMAALPVLAHADPSPVANRVIVQQALQQQMQTQLQTQQTQLQAQQDLTRLQIQAQLQQQNLQLQQLLLQQQLQMLRLPRTGRTSSSKSHKVHTHSP